MAKTTVIIPCIDSEIDFTRVAPIVAHPLFARMNGVRVMGVGHKIFPGGQHSRMEHLLGTYQRTKRLVRRLMDEKRVDRWDEGPLVVYGLLHDIGHGPFSHQIEPIARMNHKENGVRVIREMAEVIRSVSVDPVRIVAMLERRDPLSAIVSDGNLGADRRDYLERDAYHIGIRGAPETKGITRHLVWSQSHGLGVSSEAIEDAKKFLRDYAYMYKRVYLKKASILAQRQLQKMLGCLLSDGLDEDALWLMTDAEVEGLLAVAKDPATSWLYHRYRDCRFPQTVLAVRPEETVCFEPKGAKTIGVPAQTFEVARAKMNAAWLTRLESEIARGLGLDPHQVVAAAPLEERYFRPADLTIFKDDVPSSFRERDPELFADIERDFARYAALRIAVQDDDREVATRKIDAIEIIVRDTLAAAAK